MALDEPRGGALVVGTSTGSDGLTDEERALVLAPRHGWLGPAQPPPQRSPWRYLLGALGLTIGLLIAAILVVVLLAVVNVITTTNQTASGLGERANAAVAMTGQVATGVLQEVSDRLNPSHPPRGALIQDAEFESLRLVRPGETLGETGEYTFRLEAINHRDGAVTPDTAQYAVVKRLYRVPRETKVLGMTLRVDRGEADYYLDKGESFRIGPAVYKVNWVSAERDQVAIAHYRTPSQAPTTLDFAHD